MYILSYCEDDECCCSGVGQILCGVLIYICLQLVARYCVIAYVTYSLHSKSPHAMSQNHRLLR